jgi:hypothetical protein
MPVSFIFTTYSILRHARDRLTRLRRRQSRVGLRVLLVLAVTVLGVLSLADPALAISTFAKVSSAPTSEASTNPGENLVTWLSGWVGGLFALAIGGAGIAVAARRHVGEGLALLLVAVMVGGFVVDPADMNTLTTAIWHKIATGA